MLKLKYKLSARLAFIFILPGGNRPAAPRYATGHDILYCIYMH